MTQIEQIFTDFCCYLRHAKIIFMLILPICRHYVTTNV